jgi:hypothetical protein
MDGGAGGSHGGKPGSGGMSGTGGMAGGGGEEGIAGGGGGGSPSHMNETTKRPVTTPSSPCKIHERESCMQERRPSESPTCFSAVRGRKVLLPFVVASSYATSASSPTPTETLAHGRSTSISAIDASATSSSFFAW